MDAFLQRLPGSPRTKLAAATSGILLLLAYPVFRSTEGRQGHDYMSSERPEAIRARQEKERRAYLKARLKKTIEGNKEE